MNPRSGCRFAYLVTIAAAAACSDSSGPAAGDPIEIISGAALSDTIEAYLAEPLVVAVHDENGRPVPGTTVVFGTTCDDDCDLYLVEEDGSETGISERTTDSRGRVSVMLRLGRHAREVELRISAATELAHAPFTVRAGNAAGVRFMPDIFGVYRGEPTAVYANAVDRRRNRREDPVEYMPAESGAYTITPDGIVTGLEYGITHLDVRSGEFTARDEFVIVPPGSFAAGGGLLGIREMNGGEWRFSRHGAGHWPDWHPAGQRLVYYAPTPAGDRLFFTDAKPEATPIELKQSAAFPLQHARNPRYTRDGEWVFFEGATDGERAGEIWRIRSIGGGDERIGAVATATAGDFHPDPSPDGTEVVFSSNRTGATPGELVVRTIATGEERLLGVVGDRPSWSPDGEWIAYAAPTASGTPNRYVHLVRPDGSEAHRLSPSGWSMREGTVDWSPDGAWLLVADGDLDLIEVATGRRVPLLPTPGIAITSASWRP